MSIKTLITLFQKEVLNQELLEEEKVKLALVGRGEYRLVDKYKKQFFINEQQFYYGRKDKRVKVWNAFCSFIPSVEVTTFLPTVSKINEDIDLSSLDITLLPKTIVKEIAEEAVKLKGRVLKYDEEIYYVENEKNLNEPHKVRFKERSTKLSCDSKTCKRFYVFNICAHVVATAHELKVLDQFIAKLNSSKKIRKPFSKEKTAGKKPIKRKGPPNQVPIPVKKHVMPKEANSLSIDTDLVKMIPDGKALAKVNCHPVKAFCLKWIECTKVRVCYGCLEAIVNPPSNDLEKLAIVYRDTQFSYGKEIVSKLQNVHFHLNPECVWKKYPEFIPSSLVVPPKFIPFLSVEHKRFLSVNFHVDIS